MNKFEMCLGKAVLVDEMCMVDRIFQVGLLVVVSLIPYVSKSMPDAKEIEQAKPVVMALVSDIVKYKNVEASKVANEIMVMSEKAEKEVEKFLLHREAASWYFKAGKAAPVMRLSESCHAAGDDASMFAIYRYAFEGLTYRQKTRLRETADYKEYVEYLKKIKNAAREELQSEQKLASLEAEHRKEPENVRICGQLAIEYLERGKLNNAWPMLAKCGGVIAEAAKAELGNADASGMKAVKVGDAWWQVMEKKYPKTLLRAGHQRILKWYGKSLEDPELNNLVRLRVEGRLSEIRKRPVDISENRKDNVAGAFPSVAVTGGEKVKLQLGKSKKHEGSTLELVACPRGEFTMGVDDSFNNRKHTVNLTYPYLISSTLATIGMLRSVDGQLANESCARIVKQEREDFTTRINDYTPICGLSHGEIEKFCRQLTELTYKSPELRPYRGYEFRLPTEAEWSRAYLADKRVQFRRVGVEERRGYWKSKRWWSGFLGGGLKKSQLMILQHFSNVHRIIGGFIILEKAMKYLLI